MRTIILAFSFLFYLTLSGAAAQDTAKSALPLNSPDGRWNVTFDIPEQQYRTVIELSVASDGTVSAANLGYPLLKFTDGRLVDGSKLFLKGTSPYGAVAINAALAGDVFDGKWQVALLGGAVRGTRDAAASRSAVSRIAVFDRVWDTIDKQFYDPKFNGVDWQSVRARYRPQAEAARADGELVAVIRNMLDELRSSHLSFSAVSFEQSFVAAKEISTGKTPPPIVWRKLSPSLGYLQIKQFDESAEIIRQVDAAFAELGALPSLVVDVRGNPGGTLSAAMRVGDYLFAAKRPVGYFVTRAGLARRNTLSAEQIKPATLPTYSGYNLADFRRELDRTGALTITTGGRAKSYRGRVVLLVDERCGSTTEGFASVVKETGAATLIGRRTAGAMLSSIEIPIVGGWTLRLPEADFRTPLGVRVEGKGVEPDVAVQKIPNGDADLARALSFLQTGASTAQSENSRLSVKSVNPQTRTAKQSVLMPRTVEAFRRIERRMTMKRVIELCGEPDEDIGSGIHIYVYRLADGSTVRIGTPDDKRILYVVQALKNGERRFLLENK